MHIIFFMNTTPIFTSKTHSDIIFPLTKQLGQGKFTAYKVSQNGKKYALKLYPADEVLYYKNEARFQIVSHPRLVTPLLTTEGWLVLDYDKKYHYAVLTEYCSYGDLYKHLTRHKLKFDEKLTRTIFKQVVDGLEYLHSLGIAHLDIKLDNIFIDRSFHARLGDFDIAFMKGDEKLCRGTTDYHAPEIGKTKNYDPYKADIFSLGITLFCLLSGGILPFKQKYPEFMETYLKDKRIYWDFIKQKINVITQDFIELFDGMIEQNPAKRFGIREIKRSRWYNDESYNDDEMTHVYKNLFKY